MEYALNLGLGGGIFAVPNAVADRYLRLCSGAQLKTLLLLLRRPEQPASPEQIARELKMAPEDAADCLNYWVEQGLLCPAGQTAAPPAPEPAPAPPAPQPLPAPAPAAVHTAPTGQKVVTHARQRLTAADINQMARKDSNIPLLLQETQLLLGRELTPAQSGTLMELYSDFGLSPQYLFTLINYCVSIGKGNMNYIESTAAHWVEQGVDTVERAEAQITRLNAAHQQEGQVKAAFGIRDRELSTNQKACVARWFGEYGMALEMIRLAYDQTVDNIGKVSFPYMDKVLLNWHQQGIGSPEQLKKAEEARARQTHAQPKPSYDMEQIRQRFEYGKIK